MINFLVLFLAQSEYYSNICNAKYRNIVATVEHRSNCSHFLRAFFMPTLKIWAAAIPTYFISPTGCNLRCLATGSVWPSFFSTQ